MFTPNAFIALDLISLEESVYCLLNEILERKEIPVSFALLDDNIKKGHVFHVHPLSIPNGDLAVL